MTYKTCNHLYDTGGTCNSAAVKDRDYCAFHLGYRVRQLRSAQARARMERFDLHLPPIESMATVLSAVNQLVEAVAADMIDLKRADFLLKSLRFAAQALKSSDKWLPGVYYSDQPAPAIDLAAEYGLPADLDPNTRPEVAFPCPVASETDNWPPTTDNSDFSPMPTVDYCEHGPAVPSTPSAPTIPRPPNSQNSARCTNLRAGKQPVLATSGNSKTVSGAMSTRNANATPRSRWSGTCASPPSAWPNANSSSKPSLKRKPLRVAHNCLPLAIVGMRPRNRQCPPPHQNPSNRRPSPSPN